VAVHPKTPRLKWSEIGVLVMLAALVTIGLVGAPATPRVAAVTFGGGVLFLAWLSRLTYRGMKWPPFSWQRAVFCVTVFFVWLAFIAALAWALW
jgi:hypothetical protein